MEIMTFDEWLCSVKKLSDKEIKGLASDSKRFRRLSKEYVRFVKMWKLRGIIE